MPQTTLQSVFTGLAGVALAIGGISSAQAQLPTCQAPRSNEFLLLIVTRTPDSQARVRSVVSRDANLSVCNYFGETVTRVGGYRDADTANSWANYLNDTVRLRAFVATPPGGAQVANQGDLPPARVAVSQPIQTQPLQTQPDLAYARNAGGYNPQLLGDGFAVIVNHYNRPEVAAQMQRVLNRNIGLASFEQRPYLLAVQTSDRAIADSILQILSDRGFAAMLVRSNRVTLLTPVVQTEPSIGSQ
ncbi:MAG: hypothetical protein KME10_08840 [Plectolyngbya sp. WJT66-NPBG17]|jgi:hypothetical protein|nr:hypothetical protein [Plectolyngbya sp. WJT66-NPBG17]